MSRDLKKACGGWLNALAGVNAFYLVSSYCSTQPPSNMLAALLASSTWNEYVIKRNLIAMAAVFFAVRLITSSNIPILTALLSSRLATVLGMYKIVSRFIHLTLTNAYRSYHDACFSLQRLLPCHINPVQPVDLTKVPPVQLSLQHWPCYARCLHAH